MPRVVPDDPVAVAGRPRVLEPAVELAPVDTSVVPNSGPTVASRTVMVVGGLVSKAAARLRALVEERSGGTFADVYRADAAAHGATRIDQQYEPEVEVEFDEATHTGDAYPAFGWACAVAAVPSSAASAEERMRIIGVIGACCIIGEFALSAPATAPRRWPNASAGGRDPATEGSGGAGDEPAAGHRPVRFPGK